MGSALSLALQLQEKLQIVADANVNWKAGVIGVSTGVYLLETYLTCVVSLYTKPVSALTYHRIM